MSSNRKTLQNFFQWGQLIYRCACCKSSCSSQNACFLSSFYITTYRYIYIYHDISMRYGPLENRAIFRKTPNFRLQATCVKESLRAVTSQQSSPNHHSYPWIVKTAKALGEKYVCPCNHAKLVLTPTGKIPLVLTVYHWRELKVGKQNAVLLPLAFSLPIKASRKSIQAKSHPQEQTLVEVEQLLPNLANKTIEFLIRCLGCSPVLLFLLETCHCDYCYPTMQIYVRHVMTCDMCIFLQFSKCTCH